MHKNKETSRRSNKNSPYEIFKNVRSGEVEKVQHLAELHQHKLLSEKNKYKNSEGENIFHTLVRIGDPEKRKKILDILLPLLKKAPDVINHKSDKELSPLELASSMNRSDLLLPFLKNGAEIGDSLVLATEKSYAECIKILQEHKKHKILKNTAKNPLVATSGVLFVFCSIGALCALAYLHKKSLPTIIMSALSGAFFISTVVFFAFFFRKNLKASYAHTGNEKDDDYAAPQRLSNQDVRQTSLQNVTSTKSENKKPSKTATSANLDPSKSQDTKINIGNIMGKPSKSEKDDYRLMKSINSSRTETGSTKTGRSNPTNATAVDEKSLINDLFTAIESGDKSALEKLLAYISANGRNITKIIDATNHKDETPLFSSILKHNAETCKALIDAGASLTTTSKFGNNLLHVAADVATERSDITILKILVSKIQSNAIKDQSSYDSILNAKDILGYTPLIKIANLHTPKQNILHEFTALINAGAKLEICDNTGNNALHYFVRKAEDAVYSFLSNKKLHPHVNASNVPNKDGKTPLDIAIDSHKYDIAETLFKSTKCSEGQCTRLISALESIKGISGANDGFHNSDYLLEAILDYTAKNFPDVLTKISGAAGTNITSANIRSGESSKTTQKVKADADKNSTLLIARSKTRLESFLESQPKLSKTTKKRKAENVATNGNSKKADADKKDKSQNALAIKNLSSALFKAIESANYSELEALLKNPQIDVSKFIDATNAKGETPLFVAILKHDTEACRALIKAGANCNMNIKKSYNDGHTNPITCLELAISLKSLDVFKLLIDSGADLNITNHPYGILNYAILHYNIEILSELIYAIKADLGEYSKILIMPDEKGINPLMQSVMGSVKKDKGLIDYRLFFALFNAISELHESNDNEINARDIVHALDKSGRNVLHHLATSYDENSKMIINFLKNYDLKKLNQPDGSGKTPLEIAILKLTAELQAHNVEGTALSGRLDFIKELFAIFEPDKTQCEKLHSILKDPEISDKDHPSLIMYNAVMEYINEAALYESFDILCNSVRKQDIKSFRECLSDLVDSNMEGNIAKVIYREDDSGKTLFHIAADTKNPEFLESFNDSIIDFLSIKAIKHKAAKIISKRNSSGKTLLHITADTENIDLCEKLIFHIAADTENPESLESFNGFIIDFLSKEMKPKAAEIINKRNSSGKTLLHIAADTEIIDLCERLIGNGGDCNISRKDGSYCLDIAITKNNINMVNLFIKKGANLLNSSNNYGIFHSAIMHKNKEIIEAIVEAVANKIIKSKKYRMLLNKQGDQGRTPLMEILSTNFSTDDINKLCKLLIYAGAELDTCDENGDNILHYAVKHHDNLDSFLNIIGHKTKRENVIKQLNTHNNAGDTPLDIAAIFHKYDYVDTLLRRIDPNYEQSSKLIEILQKNVPNEETLQAESHNKVLEKVRKHYQVEKSFNSLMSIIDSGKNGELKKFLDEEKKKYENSGGCALFVDKHNEKGETPLFKAILMGNTAACKMLINTGADPKKHCNIKTPLFEAILMGNIAACKILINAGANMNVYSHSQEYVPAHYSSKTLVSKDKTILLSCLDLAIEKDMEIFKLLVDSGADLTKFSNESGILNHVIQNCDVEIVEKIILKIVKQTKKSKEDHALLNQLSDKGSTALMQILMMDEDKLSTQKISELCVALVSAGAELGICDKSSKNILHYIAENPNKPHDFLNDDALKELSTIKGKCKFSPLSSAVYHCNFTFLGRMLSAIQPDKSLLMDLVKTHEESKKAKPDLIDDHQLHIKECILKYANTNFGKDYAKTLFDENCNKANEEDVDADSITTNADEVASKSKSDLQHSDNEENKDARKIPQTNIHTPSSEPLKGLIKHNKDSA